jgi:PAS domain S-box-containing protein
MKQSELTFQLMVESVPNAIVLVNAQGKIAYLNSQSEKLFGYLRNELIGKPVEALIPERFRANHPAYRKQFHENPVVRPMGEGRDLFAQHKNGVEIPIEIGITPIVTVEGTLVLASIIDITERKKAEERFRRLINSAPNAIILINSTGIITLVNDQAKKLFDYQDVEMLGQRLEMLIPDRYKNDHESFRSTFFAKPQARAMGTGRDLYALRRGGIEIPVEIGLSPMDTDEGPMVLASIIDITQRKIFEKTVQRQAELEIKNKELEQFAYVASHDLQEPIKTVTNYIQILQEEYSDKLDQDAKKFLNIIHRASSRMSSLVKGLLEFSRLGRDCKLIQAHIADILNDSLADLEDTIKNTRAVIHIGSLPKLNVYDTEIRRLFQNLASNAIKFKKQDVPPEINIDARQVGDQWEFCISDNGIGIESKHYDRIFQIFQRLHNTGTYEGHGIGLANCRKIVELHGGKIWVKSVPGKGSAFYFTISNLKL